MKIDPQKDCYIKNYVDRVKKKKQQKSRETDINYKVRVRRKSLAMGKL